VVREVMWECGSITRIVHDEEIDRLCYWNGNTLSLTVTVMPSENGGRTPSSTGRGSRLETGG